MSMVDFQYHYSSLHSNMLICSLNIFFNYYYKCWKQLLLNIFCGNHMHLFSGFFNEQKVYNN